MKILGGGEEDPRPHPPSKCNTDNYGVAIFFFFKALSYVRNGTRSMSKYTQCTDYVYQGSSQRVKEGLTTPDHPHLLLFMRPGGKIMFKTTSML